MAYMMDNLVQPNISSVASNLGPDWLSSEQSTGTSIMACEFDGGVVIGADSRATTGAYISNRFADKLTKITDHIYCCRSGSAADTQAISDIVAYHLSLHKMELGMEPLVETAANVFRELCYNYRDSLMAGILVAGWDSRKGGQVYSIPLGGMCVRQPISIGGSGSTYVYGYMDAQYKPNMSRDECVKLVENTLALAMSRDGSSGGVIRIGVITEKEGSMEDRQPNWSQDMLTVQEVSEMMRSFGIWDYTVFAFMLVACGFVGIYFGFIKKSSGEDEYLVGGRNMKTFPVSLSLIASFISGISLLGTPTEVYVHGVSYLCIGFGVIIVGFVTSGIYLPIFHELRLTSTYEYLEKRFDRKIRTLGSVLFLIGIMTWLPIVIYVPALAFNQVTGVNVHVVTPFVCIVCIFYTCVGGLRAVVWTDFIQTFIMFGSMILIVVKGTSDVGGFSVVIRRNLESGRLELPTADWSPLTRHTIWSLVVGGFFHWLQVSVINQNMIQRYLALPTLKSARRALWIFIVGVLILIGICGYAGMLIYAWYHVCDPLTTKLAGAKDQLLPLLVMNILNEFPGLPGLFVAGVFSAALSSLSTGLNSMAAVVLEDFVKPFRKTPVSPRAADILLKLTVVVLGATCVALVFVVEKTGSHVLQLSMNLSSITSGPSLGIFSMGILLPWVNAKGALIGGLSGLGFMGWISLSAEAAIASGRIKFDEKPVSTEGCYYSFPQVENLMLLEPPDTILDGDEFLPEPLALYRLSYLWYTVTGALVTMTIGLVVSLISSEKVEKLDPMLLAPFIRKLLKISGKEPHQEVENLEVHSLEIRRAGEENAAESVSH